MKKSDLNCWIVGEGLAGTENQCIGVAEALGVKPVIKRLTLREPWKSLSPYLGLEQWWSFDPLLYPPWPELIIASGRKSIAPSRYIRKKSDGYTLTVQLQDPRIPPDNFDLVAVPAHDSLRGDNVVVTTAAPNRITASRLKSEALKFPAFKKSDQRKNIAVLIGGNSKTHQFTKAIAEKLVTDLNALDGFLMVTLSRRTPPALQRYLKDNLRKDRCYIWDGEGDNPYFAYLHFADVVLVTGDSASMLSEAATTGKPVYMIPLKGGSDKFTRLYKTLSDHGAMRVFEGRLEHWTYSPLNDAQKVAKAVEKLLIQRQM